MHKAFGQLRPPDLLWCCSRRGWPRQQTVFRLQKYRGNISGISPSEPCSLDLSSAQDAAGSSTAPRAAFGFSGHGGDPQGCSGSQSPSPPWEAWGPFQFPVSFLPMGIPEAILVPNPYFLHRKARQTSACTKILAAFCILPALPGADLGHLPFAKQRFGMVCKQLLFHWSFSLATLGSALPLCTLVLAACFCLMPAAPCRKDAVNLDVCSISHLQQPLWQ